MFKRYIAIILSSIMLILSLPLNTFAEIVDKDGNAVTLNKDTKQWVLTSDKKTIVQSADIDLSKSTPTGITEEDEALEALKKNSNSSNTEESDKQEVPVNENVYYNQAYASMVMLTIDAGGTLEQIELQLLRYAAIDKEEDVLSKIPSLSQDVTTLIGNIEANATNNRSIFKTNDKDILLGPLKTIADPESLENSAEDTISGKFRESLFLKAKSIFNLITDLDSDQNLQYSAVCYVLNTCQLLNEFSYADNSTIPTEVNDLLNKECKDGLALIELKSKMEADGSKNLLSEINEDVFAESESAFKATRIYQAFLQDISGEGDYYYTRELIAGKALSSSYIPLRTNVNNNPYLDIPDLETFKSFNSTYGTLRKALMISTSNKSVSQMFITGQLSSFRPATLRDFIENVKDEKTFIVDAGYYNSDTHESHDWSGDERIKFTLGSDDVALQEQATETVSTSSNEQEVEGTGEVSSDSSSSDSSETKNEEKVTDPLGIAGKEISEIKDLVYSKLPDGSTFDANKATYDDCAKLESSSGNFISIQAGQLVATGSIVRGKIDGSDEVMYFKAVRAGESEAPDALKIGYYDDTVDDWNDGGCKLTNAYVSISKSGDSKVYTSSQIKDLTLMYISDSNPKSLNLYYRAPWKDGSGNTKYTEVSFSKLIVPNGNYMKYPDKNGNKWYTSVNGYWYEIVKDGDKVKVGNQITDDIGNKSNPKKLDEFKHQTSAPKADEISDPKETASSGDKDSKEETTQEAKEEFNEDGTPKKVAGENIYEDAFTPQTVYALGTDYDYYIVAEQQHDVSDFNKTQNDKTWNAIKNTYKKELNGKTWWEHYPTNLITSVEDDKGFINIGGDANNVLEYFPTKEAIAKYKEKLKSNTKEDVEAAKASIAYIYHWMGPARLTHLDNKEDSERLKALLNDNELLKEAINFHFSTLNNKGKSSDKTKVFGQSLAMGILCCEDLGNTRKYLDAVRKATNELVASNTITQLNGEVLYSYVAIGLGNINLSYKGQSQALSILDAGVNATTSPLKTLGQAIYGSSNKNFIKNVNNIQSAYMLDADDVMWLFDDDEFNKITSGSGNMQTTLQNNVRKILRNNILKSCSDPLGKIGDVFDKTVVQAKDTYDGSILKALFNTDDFIDTLGFTGDQITLGVHNSVAIIQAIFGSKVSNHPGYETFPDTGRNALIEALPDSIKSPLKKCFEVKKFCEEVSKLLDSATSFKGLASDIWNELVKAKQKETDQDAIDKDNASNENDDLLKSNGTAAKLTTNDVDAIADSISPEAIKEVFDTWYNKPNHFTLGLNPQEQATLLGSKLLRQDINLNVEENLDSSNNNFNSWYGIAFALDCMNHAKLADAVVGFENKPVFRSAPTAGDESFQDAIFNYMLLSNIAESYPIRWDAVLDLDSPVFIDIYGNILTESGLVIIPFAANSTLHKKISILNSAFLHSYGSAKTFGLEMNDITETPKAIVDDNYYFSLHQEKVVNSISEYPAFSDAGLSDEEAQLLIPDENSETWIINPIAINTDQGIIALNKIETTDMNAAKVLYTLTMSNYTNNISSKSTENAFININSDISNILYQVMRGDRIENIDYAKENLNTGNNYNPTIISQANKYENLVDQLSEVGNNSLISVPDITTMTGVEYIVFFIYKILLLIFIFYLLVQVYLATISQTFGLNTIGKIFVAFLCVAVVIVSQPYIYKLSYYYTNRFLLQDEAELVAMLNREKTLNNVELGVVNARNAEKESKIMLKVTEIDVDLFGYMSHVIDAATVGSLTEYYERHIQHDIETIVDEYEQRGAALYYDVEDLYDTSIITVDQTTNQLLNVTKGAPAIAFRSPYYAILDYLIRNVNDYNALIDSYDYGLVSSGDGSIRTIGMTDRYFHSSAFGISRYDILHNSDKIPANIDESILSFASYDRCGVFAIYGISGIDNRNIWSEEELNSMRESAWYADNLPNYSEDNAEVEALSKYLDDEAIHWVNSNKHMIGRISDETILKALALHLSLAYNRYLGADGPKYFEIENISTNDILRVSTVAKTDVMTSSPFTFPKFILVNAGLPGVYMSALLTMVTFILAIVKPATTVITFMVLILSLVIYRLLLNQKTEAIKGVLKYACVLSIVNVSYSLILKFFMLIPEGIPPFVRILLLIITHMIYIAAYVWLLSVVVFNWRDFGSNAFSNMVHMRSLNIKQISTASINDKSNTGRNIYERLKDSDKWRNRHK